MPSPHTPPHGLTHTGDNYADHSRAVFIMERARHVSRMIDHVLGAWPDRDHVDAKRIGMFGFSAGGFTALVDIGGVPDLSKTAPFCREHSDHFACMLLARHASGGAVAGAGRDGGHDPRIKAEVSAAPALGFTFAPDGLKSVTVPVQLWRAEDDTILPQPGYAEAVRQALNKLCARSRDCRPRAR